MTKGRPLALSEGWARGSLGTLGDRYSFLGAVKGQHRLWDKVWRGQRPARGGRPEEVTLTLTPEGR